MENIKKYILHAMVFALGLVLGFSISYFTKKDAATQPELDEVAMEIVNKASKEGEDQKDAEKKILQDMQGAQEKESALAKEPSSNDRNFDYIKVSDQKAGKEVSVAYAKADFPFWLVVHAEKDGKIWNALGARRKVEGEYTGVVVPLLASTKAGARYWLVLYKDNGDAQFDLKSDFPVKLDDGSFVMVDFKAL